MKLALPVPCGLCGWSSLVVLLWATLGGLNGHVLVPLLGKPGKNL